MKIVIGGATNTGKSIVGYLTMGNNDIVVVDDDASRLDELAKKYDLQPVLGSISRPDIQQKIGMDKADMLIAVTDSDEVNLIACQVAYTLFNVEQKIARVDSQYFLNPMWNSLYNEKSLPVDLVITPDIEIAKYILNLFDYPGCLSLYPFAKGNINIFSFINKSNDSPFTGFTIAHINEKLHDLSAAIVLICREGNILPVLSSNVVLQKNDIVYVCTDKNTNIDVMHLFGIDHNPYENVVIFGGNAISYYIASNLETNDSISSCNIVEENPLSAQKLAENLSETSIVVGESTSDTILDEVGFGDADICISVTNKDKDNLLLALLAAKNKNTQALALVNSKDYKLLTSNNKNTVIIDRSLITISALLSYLRKARIEKAYSLGHNIGEIWEIRLGEDSSLIGKEISNIKLPAQSSVIFVICNTNSVIYNKEHRLNADDKIVVYVHSDDIREVEKIFYR